LPGVLDPLLQDGTHGGRGGVGDECKWREWVRVCQECGVRQNSLALFKGLQELWRPSDGDGALDSGAGEDVGKLGLGGCCVGQESPVEI
jgi:hypothetical protein